MTKGKETKRENFDVSPEQQADIETLQALLETPSKKDAVLMAVQMALHLAAETKKGNQLFVGHPGEDLKRFVLLGIEKPGVHRWMYLVEHSHPWKRQLYVKGRKLPAAAVWIGIRTNNLSIEEAMDNWDLSKAVIQEIVEYCDSHKDLLEMEAAEELRLLCEKESRLALRLLVDECIQAKLLVAKLVAAGHDIQTALQAGLTGFRDDAVFAAAIADNGIVLTINCADFIALSIATTEQGLQHPGVFLIYLHNDPKRDMSYDRIVKAIENLEGTQVPLSNNSHSLNQYDY